MSHPCTVYRIRLEMKACDVQRDLEAVYANKFTLTCLTRVGIGLTNVCHIGCIEVALQSHPPMTSDRIQVSMRVDCAPVHCSHLCPYRSPQCSEHGLRNNLAISTRVI